MGSSACRSVRRFPSPSGLGPPARACPKTKSPRGPKLGPAIGGWPGGRISPTGLGRLGGLRFVPVGLRDGVKRNRIRTRPEDRSGSGRSGTVAGGLSRLRGAPIGTFGGAKGRVSTAVNQRLEDRGGRLWLSQTRGLVIRLAGQAGAVGMAPGVEPAVHHGTAPGAQRKAVGVRVQPRSAAVSRRTVQPLHRSADVLLSLPGRPRAGARGYGAGTGRRRIHSLALAATGTGARGYGGSYGVFFSSGFAGAGAGAAGAGGGAGSKSSSDFCGRLVKV